MSSTIIYAQGGLGVDITIPSTERIAIWTKGEAKVYQVGSYTNFPDTQSLLGTVNNEQKIFGAYADGATLQIHAGAAPVYYQIGSNPVVIEQYNYQLQGAPTAETGAATLTVAELLTGIITISHSGGATANLTLPTGTLTDAGLALAIGESFDWSVINTSAAAVDTATIVAGTGHTVVGVMVVQSAHATTGTLYGNAGRFRTRKTAANTFVTYRIA